MNKFIFILIGLITIMNFNVMAYEGKCWHFDKGEYFCINGSGFINGTISYTNVVGLSINYVSRNDWTTIDDYPSSCASGEFVTGIGDSLTCVAPLISSDRWDIETEWLYNNSNVLTFNETHLNKTIIDLAGSGGGNSTGTPTQGTYYDFTIGHSSTETTGTYYDYINYNSGIYYDYINYEVN